MTVEKANLILDYPAALDQSHHLFLKRVRCLLDVLLILAHALDTSEEHVDLLLLVLPFSDK